MSQRDRRHHNTYSSSHPISHRSSQQSSPPPPPQAQRPRSAMDNDRDPRQQKKLTKITNIFKRSASATASSSPTRNGHRSNREDQSNMNSSVSMSQPVYSSHQQQQQHYGERDRDEEYGSFSQPLQYRTGSSSDARHQPYQPQLKRTHKDSLLQQPVYKTSFITPIKESPVKKKRKHYYDHNNEEEYEEHSTSMQVPLAVDDSPIIRRNKEMRETTQNRRSSLGRRGKRASSIGNGFSATPHDAIPTEELYKHIDQDLPEPQKMRQLLTWCSSRVLEADSRKHIKQKNLVPQSDITTLNIAKMIKEEIVKDLKDGKINTSWWTQHAEGANEVGQEERDQEQVDLPKKPNERNILNATLLETLKEKLAELKKDVSEWEALESEHGKNIKSLNFEFDDASVSQMDKRVNINNNQHEFKQVLDHSIINEVIDMEDATNKRIIGNLQETMDDFNDMVFKLKSSHDLRERYVGIQSQKLTNFINAGGVVVDDDNINTAVSHFQKVKNSQNGKNPDARLILRAITRVEKS
ncbi:hypothetical protein WICPIJ_002154 [Wickerhamomyces pijperi]|uniref:Kinetochore protein mis13 n=1 Tax=Wickerhamomyces pijperi TaxID=599730 RepID=A0A9P8TQ30_WICPI|nr:hypothetical protein WICPIJ_002154 [Wickerhamomyces pijperi]